MSESERMPLRNSEYRIGFWSKRGRLYYYFVKDLNGCTTAAGNRHSATAEQMLMPWPNPSPACG